MRILGFSRSFNKRDQTTTNTNLIYKYFTSATLLTATQPETATHEEQRTLHSLLQLSAKSRDPRNGKACHALALRLGLAAETLTSNMIMNVYSKCGMVDDARKVFDGMPERSLVSWNTMIGGYARQGDDGAAVALFLELMEMGCLFSEYTLSTVLCICAGRRDVIGSMQLHAFAYKYGIVDNSFVGTALLDVYAKSGLVWDARLVFEGMDEKGGVTWSSMIAGFVQNELYEEALQLFSRGHELGLDFFEFSLSSAVCACVGLTALIEGKQVHAVVYRTGFGSNLFIVSSLVDMYAKCGSIREAYMVFSDAERKNVVLWNAMISGLAKHSRTLEVMVLFEKMQQVGLCPDEVTYVAVLSACSHVGLVDKARSYFDLMQSEHKVPRSVLHYSCMVDVLGRVGLTCEAYEILRGMPFNATAPMWGSLLASCRTHGNLEIAKVAAKELVELEPDNAGNYILLCHMYAANQQWEEAAKTWKFLQANEVRKETGESWIEIKDRVHTFSVGEKRHPRIREVYLELDKLQEEMKKLSDKSQTDQNLDALEGSYRGFACP